MFWGIDLGYSDIADSTNIGYYGYEFPLDALELEPPKTAHKDYEANVLSELRPVGD